MGIYSEPGDKSFSRVLTLSQVYRSLLSLSIIYMSGGCSLFKIDMRLKASILSFVCAHVREAALQIIAFVFEYIFN